jgi:hypothetical protein
LILSGETAGLPGAVIVRRAGVKVWQGGPRSYKDRAALCGGVIPERPRKTKTRPRPEEKQELSKMMFTGTLIEDLIAAVERAEAKAKDFETATIEPWFASVQENATYDPKLLGVA